MSNALTVSLDDCTSGQLQRRVQIRLPRTGRVVLSVRLNYQTAAVSQIYVCHRKKSPMAG